MSKEKLEHNTNPVGETIGRPHSKGITLIALIITIIVMLILVGVTVNVALNGGLFDIAKQATEETKIAADKEFLMAEMLAVYDAETGINTGKLKTNLEAAGWTVETEDGQTVYISPNNKKYTIGQNFEIAYIGDYVEESVKYIDNDEPLEIGSIEELVDLSIAVNAGTTYEGETVTLLTSLDFDNPESYRTENPQTTIYTDAEGNEIDINGNGTAEPIMTELTTGTGFMPIGKTIGTHAELGLPLANSFAGTFDGNGKTLKNLYINRPTESAALFGDISTNAKIKNLTIKNPEIYGMYASGLAISNAVPAELTGETLTNYANDVLTIENCHTKGGNIGAVNENCISQISAGLFINPMISLGTVNIEKSSNGSVISGLQSAGLTYLPQMMAFGKITIAECENYGNIIVEDIDTYNTASEDYGSLTAGCIIGLLQNYSGGLEITNCSNYGNLTGVNSIVGVAVTSNASVSNCSNYGTLSSLSGEKIVVAGVVCDNAEDAPPDGIEKKIEGCKNYGDINISSDNMTEFEVAGIVNGSDENKILNCINNGNISISGTINYNSSGLEWKVAGINTRYDSDVMNCINYGNITVDTQWQQNQGRIYIGGISYAGNEIINCANYGTIEGDSVAGIAYDNAKEIETHIYNCYNAGNIISSTNLYAGIGAGAVIKNSYNLGTITGTGGNEGEQTIGYQSTVDSSCHALTGNETPEEITAVLNALKAREGDTEGTWSDWTTNADLNNGYPVFSWQTAEE